MTITKYAHYSKIPADKWTWKSFSPEEIACRGTGEIVVNTDALDKLQALRNKLGKPLIINSAYRSATHNKAIGGAKDSQHMKGIAFDVSMANHKPREFIRAAKEVGFTGIGQYPRQNFVHIDTGPSRAWNDGKNFPADAPTFTPEKKPKPLVKSRTVAGAGVAGAATVVTPFVAPLQAATEAQPLLAWVLAGVVLIGLGIVLYAYLDDRKKGAR